jgi:hypothetical protein
LTVGKEKQLRIIASAVIRRVLLENLRHSSSVLNAVDAAYPFGQRRGSPYRIWRDEFRRALAEPSKKRGAAA